MKRNWFPVLLVIIISWVITVEVQDAFRKGKQDEEWFKAYVAGEEHDSVWIAPSLYDDFETTGKERASIIYGQDLIAHTSKYLGPNGSVSQTTNGMNCQNCHLDAGTRPWGNNYLAVYATYPQLRARSNSIQDIYGRVNDCLVRSLNGKAIARNSYEMQSIYAYMRWLGQHVPKGKKPAGAGLSKLPFLERAASQEKGSTVYMNFCRTCHGENGEGNYSTKDLEYVYPPLWGKHSYNDGAGLYRLSSFAGFVKNNMPFNKATYRHPELTDEQAWDVAAFVNTQPRPHFDQRNDWPDLSKKVIDAPFAPYADGFSESQHKYGPYGPIAAAKNKNHSSQ